MLFFFQVVSLQKEVERLKSHLQDQQQQTEQQLLTRQGQRDQANELAQVSNRSMGYLSVVALQISKLLLKYSSQERCQFTFQSTGKHSMFGKNGSCTKSPVFVLVAVIIKS